MKHLNIIKLSLVTLLLVGCSGNNNQGSSKEYDVVNSYTDLPFALMDQQSEQINTNRYLGYGVRLTPDLGTIDVVDDEHQIYSKEALEKENSLCNSSTGFTTGYGVQAESVDGIVDRFWNALKLTDIHRSENVENYMKLKVKNYFNEKFSHTLKRIDSSEYKSLYVIMEGLYSWSISGRGEGLFQAEINENFAKDCETAIEEDTYSAYCNIFETYGIGVVNQITYWPVNCTILGFSSKDYYANLSVNGYNQSALLEVVNKLVKEEGSLALCDCITNAAEENTVRLLDYDFKPIYKVLSLTSEESKGFQQAYNRYISEKTNELKTKIESSTYSMPAYVRDSIKVLGSQNEHQEIALGKKTKYKIDVTVSGMSEYNPAKMLELGFDKVFIRPKIRQFMKTIGFKMNDEIVVGGKCLKMMDNSLYYNYSGDLCSKWYEFNVADLLANESSIHYQFSVDSTVNIKSVELELCYASTK